ncbi:MAG: protein kinase domain-containing protein [Candidatus Woesearchaeota archaeon]
MLKFNEVMCEKTGEILSLSKQLSGGVGGEGFIYHLKEKNNIIAKIYKNKLTPNKICKLRYMINNPPKDPMDKDNHISIVWPKDLIKYNNQIVGFTMPLIIGHNLGVAYFRDQRVQTARHFTYIHLHRISYNLAKAFEACHNSGYIIGDVKDENIKVKDNSLISLLDVDSFQVPRPNPQQGYFNCKVLTPEYSPPEVLLFAKTNKVKEYNRGPEQDLFGLSILIFKLLMEGTHPFIGFLPSKENREHLEIQERIIKGYFPYQSGGRRGIPSKPAPPFNQLHPEIQKLFHKCFVEGHHLPSKRPTINEWIATLKKAENNLKKCSSNGMHYYGNHLTFCPWCKRKRKFNKDPFPELFSKKKRYKNFLKINKNSDSSSSKKVRNKIISSNNKTSISKRSLNFFTLFKSKMFILFIAFALIIFGIYNSDFTIPWSSAGHSSTINEVKWSPDGEYILSGCQGGEIHLWEAKTGNHINKIRDETDVVSSLEWAPDGAKFAAGFGRGAIKIWGAENKKPSYLYEDLQVNISSLEWVDNNNLFALNDWHTFIINSSNGNWDHFNYFNDGLATAYRNKGIIFMASIVRAENNKMLEIYNITHEHSVTKKELDLDKIYDLTISPSKEFIAIAGNRKIKIINTKGSLVQTINNDKDIFLLAKWSPKENYLAAVTNSGEIKIYDFHKEGLPDGTYLSINKRLKTKYENGFFALDWSPDEEKIVTGSRRSDGRIIKENRADESTIYNGNFTDGEILIWDWNTKEKHVLKN